RVPRGPGHARRPGPRVRGHRGGPGRAGGHGEVPDPPGPDRVGQGPRGTPGGPAAVRGEDRPMNHPEELLAAYVEGALGDQERAEVDAHLATCGTCRDEVELAARARV